MAYNTTLALSIPYRKYWTYVPALAFLNRRCRLYSRDFATEFDAYIDMLPKELSEELLQKRDGILDWISSMERIRDSIENWDFSQICDDGAVMLMNTDKIPQEERRDYMLNEVKKCRLYHAYVVEYVENTF